MIAGYAWQMNSGKRLANSLLSNFTATSSTDCLSSCAANSDCDTFNFRAADNTCELNTLGANSSNIVNSTEWAWWSNTYTVVV